MMQEDSNGESSFEFVQQKTEEASDNPRRPAGEMAAPPAVNLLSSVPPPSALPSFVVAPTVLTSEPPQASFSPARGVSLPSGASKLTGECLNNSQQLHPQVYPSQPFSAAIPQSLAENPNLQSPSEEDEQGAGSALLDWMKGAVGSGGLLSRVAEKAKSSVDSMITTLDPQMKEFIYSGGDIDIVVASNKEVKISPVREAFQIIFGRATVTGLEAQSSTVAAQPVGFAAGCRAAEERILALRQSGQAHELQPVVAVESFLLEVAEEKWFDVGVVLLNDPGRKITLQTFTQLTPVTSSVVAKAQEGTPVDYSLRWSGLAIPIGKLMGEHLQVAPGEWHQALIGVPRREIILLAAKSLAGLYKNAIDS